MRLDSDLATRLVAEMRQVYGPDAEVWLFGSRVDDTARGGDIDLYVETTDDTNRLDRYLEIRQRLFRLFGDRKIDLLVRFRNGSLCESRQRPASPIERIARKTGHKLSGVGQGPGQECQSKTVKSADYNGGI